MDNLEFNFFLELAVVIAVSVILFKVLQNILHKSPKAKINNFEAPDFIEKLKVQFKTTKSKVIAGFVIIMILFAIYENNRTKADPCDCFEVFNKEKVMGWKGLSITTQKQYNTCIKDWDNPKRANDGCTRSLGIK